MRDDELKTLFDKQAAGYDAQWARTAPIRDALLFLVESVFAELPDDARILCVGAGTGAEIAYFAQRKPRWHFVAVEPSGAMLEVCRRKATDAGFAARCEFHEGYLDTLPTTKPFDAATCFLVSQFMLEPAVRSAFFRGIATRLRRGGILASSDLSSDRESPEYDALLKAWMQTMSGAGVSAEMLDNMRVAYAKDVGVLPASQVEQIIVAGGFELPVKFYQAGLISAWFSRSAVGIE